MLSFVARTEPLREEDRRAEHKALQKNKQLARPASRFGFAQFLRDLLAPLPNPTEKSRTEWVDIGKGLCSLQMVLGHVVGGLLPLGILAASARWLAWYEWKYCFNMPALFVYCGFFLHRSAAKPLITFTDARARALLYPHFLWSVFYWAVFSQFMHFANNQRNTGFPIEIFYDAQTGMWTLFTLFYCSVAYAILRKLRVSEWIILGATALCALATAMGAFDDSPRLAAQLQHLSWFGFWLFLGAAAGEHMLKAQKSVSPIKLFSVAILLLGVSVLVYCQARLEGFAFKVAVAMPGVPGLITLAAGLGRLKLDLPHRVLSHLGRHSLEIYMLSTLGMLVSRSVLYHMVGIRSELLLLPIGLLCAFGIPFLVVYLARRESLINYLFRLPMHRRPSTPVSVPEKPVCSEAA